MTNWFDQFAVNVGRQNAPFGLAPDTGQVPATDDSMALAGGRDMIGNIGAGMLANVTLPPMQAFGRAYLDARGMAREANKDAFIGRQMMEQADDKRRDRQRLGKWQEWAAKNSGKFGDYAGIAPYLDPQQGMSILAGMTPDLTDDQREYQAAVAQGYGGTFMDYMTDLKKAGSNNVNIDMKGEGAFEKAAGESQAKRFDAIITGGDEATRMIGDIQALREIGSSFQSGKTAEVVSALGPYAEALGVRIEGLGAMQAFDAVVSRMAPMMRVAGSGSSSDFDAKQFLKSLPALGRSEAGNTVIQNTLESIAEHKIKAAEIASAALRGEISRDEAEKQMRELPDPWTLWRKVRKLYPEATGPSGSAKSPADMSDDELLRSLGVTSQ